MHIDYLELVNFRLFKRVNFKFKEGTNIILGNNSTGKTTVLEAINFILTGVLDNIQSVINFDIRSNESVFANVLANIFKDNITHNLKAIIKKINGNKLSKFFF